LVCSGTFFGESVSTIGILTDSFLGDGFEISFLGDSETFRGEALDSVGFFTDLLPDGFPTDFLEDSFAFAGVGSLGFLRD
jgi:hypothetical protein